MTERRLHRAEVVARQVLNPGMVRIVLGGDGLRDFVSTGIGDEFVRLYFPQADSGEIAHPDLASAVGKSFATNRPRSHSEVYTIRSVASERGELAIDFVVHEGGAASEWACRAKPGEPLVLTDPHAMFKPTGNVASFLFLCDATGLPALARLLEDLPPEATAKAIVEIAERSHRQELASPAALDLVWLDGCGNGIGPSRLPDALLALPPEAKPDYLWMAGEQKAARAIRRHAREAFGMPADSYAILGYWIDRREEWQAGWEVLGATVKERISNAWASQRNREDVRAEVDAILEDAGL